MVVAVAAAAPIRPLAWELPHAASAALKSKKTLARLRRGINRRAGEGVDGDRVLFYMGGQESPF